MRDNDFYSDMDVLELIAPARKTTSANGTGVDLRDYDGKLMAILTSSAGGGTSPTLAVKLQDSADNSSFADVSGLAFTGLTNAADATEAIAVEANSVRRYLRAVTTIGGTSPTFDMSVLLVGRKKAIG